MRRFAALFALLAPAILRADAPVAMYIFPAGGQRGTTVEAKVGGLFLHDRCGFEMLGAGVAFPSELKRTSTLWLEGPVLPLPDSQRSEDYPKDMAGALKIAADARTGHRSWRVWTSQGVTPAKKFVIGELPEIVEKEVEGDPIPQRVKFPATINGRIFPAENVDVWEVELKKGQSLSAVVEAARLGSPLDSRLEVRGPDGKLLAENDDANDADSALRFTASADGVHQIKIHDIAYKGSQAHVYRLTLASDVPASKTAPKPPDEPAFRLKIAADALTIPRGGQATLAITVEPAASFKQPITLSAEGLPADVTMTPTTLNAGQNAATLTFKPTATAKIQSLAIRIKGTAKVGEQTATRFAQAADIEQVRIAVALPTPFKIVGKYEMGWSARGSVAKRKFAIQRTGYDGPLTVSLADRQARHLQGVQGPTITVPAGAKEFEYPATLPPWMEIGRTCRVCVMGVGVVKEPDGTQHQVSFNSIHQNEQIVAIVEAGELELAAEAASVRAEPGKTATIPVRLTRGKGVEGAAAVELVMPAHVKGISAASISIPADQVKGALTLRFDAKESGPFNMPLILRATLQTKNGPVVAEAKLDVVPLRP